MKQGEAANFVFIEPMKALVVRDLPAGDWLYEMKLDGYRALAFKVGKEVRLVSRNRTNFDNDYPQLSFQPVEKRLPLVRLHIGIAIGSQGETNDICGLGQLKLPSASTLSTTA